MNDPQSVNLEFRDDSAKGKIRQRMKLQVVGTTTVILENGDVIILQIQAQDVLLVVGMKDQHGLQAYEVNPNIVIGRPIPPPPDAEK